MVLIYNWKKTVENSNVTRIKCPLRETGVIKYYKKKHFLKYIVNGF